MAITKNDDDSSSHNSEYCSHCQQEFSTLQVSENNFHISISLSFSSSSSFLTRRLFTNMKNNIYFHLSYNLKALKDHIMQVHQSLAGAETNGVAQHFSPPPTFSPGNFPFPLAPGVNDNRSNSQSRSPNNNTNTHACSHSQCSASFPTLELLEKHEMLQHSSGATNVVSFRKFFNFKFYLMVFYIAS